LAFPLDPTFPIREKAHTNGEVGAHRLSATPGREIKKWLIEN